MTHEEMMSLDDATLFLTLGGTLDRKFARENELQGAEIAVYTLWLFDQEVQNGGLSQFLGSETGEFAPIVPSALLTVDAVEYEALLAHFWDETDMDPESLDGCRMEKHHAAYGEFDDQYAALQEKQPLRTLVAAYIRDNAGAFCA